MGVGRFLCVALPFALTVASLICILVAMLAGVTNKQLDMFEVKTANLSISSSSLKNFENTVTRRGVGGLTATALNGVNTATGADAAANFTAASFGLADSYQVYLFKYCSTTGSKTTCTKAKYNWAATAINTTELNEKAAAVSLAATGVSAKLPKDITAALKTFAKVSKWTQVVYIISLVLAVLTLVTGLFGFCSRGGSCITYFVIGFATTAIAIASIMATVSSGIVVAAVETTSKTYGVKANMDTGFLGFTWLAVAFSLGAGLFWMFSICCCKANDRKAKNNGEKFAPTSSYQPLHDQHANTSYQGQQQGIYNPQHTKVAHGAGYEPYSHA